MIAGPNGDHFTVMQPALRNLHEATRLGTDGHPAAAIVFAASAIELFLKATILQPLVYGLVHNDNMAEIILNYTLGQAGFERYDKLLLHVFREVADIDLSTERRTGAARTVIEECKELSKQRNDRFTAHDAAIACNIAAAVYLQLVAPMLTALGLYIFDDGVISRSEYSRPVRTTRDKNGIRILIEPVDLNQKRPRLADGTIPRPQEPIS